MSSKREIFWVVEILLLVSFVRSELILLQVIYRHGDRSPITVYPTDPNSQTAWPLGLGELTNIGKEQEFELGQLLRKHYGDNLNFLDKNFNVKDVYVRSTDMDRTLMSAYCMLAGLYPPTTNETWNLNIKWQPIPVHTVPLTYDNLLYMDNPCPVYDQMKEYFMSHDPDVLRVKKENQDLIEYVGENSGLPATFDAMMGIPDTIFCELAHNMSQPTWLTANDTYKQLLELKQYSARWWNPTSEMAAFKGGNLLKMIYEYMSTKLDHPANISQKMFVYSAHDSTVAALLKTMKIYNDIIPPYSSCVMIELYSDRTVRVLYRNNTLTSENVTLIIPGCDEEFCQIDKFGSVLNQSMPDHDKACGITDPSADNFKHNMIGYSVMGCIIFLLVLLTVTMCCIYHRQRQQYRYMEVPTDMADT